MRIIIKLLENIYMNVYTALGKNTSNTFRFILFFSGIFLLCSVILTTVLFKIAPYVWLIYAILFAIMVVIIDDTKIINKYKDVHFKYSKSLFIFMLLVFIALSPLFITIIIKKLF